MSNEGFSFLFANCEISIPSILFELSHSIIGWVPWWIFSGFFQKILEGSVDHILRRDSVVTQNSFISSSLATRPAEEGSSLGIIFRSKETRQSVSWLISEVSQTWNLFLFFFFF